MSLAKDVSSGGSYQDGILTFSREGASVTIIVITKFGSLDGKTPRNTEGAAGAALFLCVRERESKRRSRENGGRRGGETMLTRAAGSAVRRNEESGGAGAGSRGKMKG